MRLLVSWVRDFVDVEASPDAIADTLALRGFEVADIESLGAADAVIDFEVTANRPDCLSVLGFAREIATAYDVPVRELSVESGALAPVSTGESDRLRVTLLDSTRCPRYASAVADVTSAAISPAWMTDRLEAAGLRPISPFVDITNYVLMELGHPMHAFDLARLSGPELRIRSARPGEPITTLDGVPRTLDSDALVIADADRAQAVAGVIGGADSEVSSSTATVAFESAYFSPTSIRRTSKRLGVKTEASARFERGADVNAPVRALQRAARLMEQLGAGRLVTPIIDRYPHPRGPRKLALRRARLARLLSLQVPDSEVSRILRGLGLHVTSTTDGWNVSAPTFRVDLLREVDLIEEVGRHYGYDRIEATFPTATAAASPPDGRIARDQLVRSIMRSAGLSEAVCFGFIEARAAQVFAPVDSGSAALVSVANPLSAKFDTLRPSLLPGLVDAVAHNRRHGRRDVGLFEVGTRFRLDTGESRGVGLAWTGAAVAEHWSGTTREVDFFDAKGIVERLVDALRVQVRFEPLSTPFLVRGRAAEVRAGDKAVGLVGVVAPTVAEQRGAPSHDEIVVAELDLDQLAQLTGPPVEVTRPLQRYPFVVRDLSILVADTLPAEIIHGTIQAAGLGGRAPLMGVSFFDRYRGRGIPAGTVSLSVRMTFQATDRTLTDEDVQETFDQILTALMRKHAVVQR